MFQDWLKIIIITKGRSEDLGASLSLSIPVSLGIDFIFGGNLPENSLENGGYRFLPNIVRDKSRPDDNRHIGIENLQRKIYDRQGALLFLYK